MFTFLVVGHSKCSGCKFEIISSRHLSKIVSDIISQHEHVLVSISFLPSCDIVQVDSFEVVQVLAVLKGPSVRQLRLLVLWISEPSVFDRLEVSIFALPSVHLLSSNGRTATVLVHDALLVDLLL